MRNVTHFSYDNYINYINIHKGGRDRTCRHVETSRCLDDTPCQHIKITFDFVPFRGVNVVLVNCRQRVAIVTEMFHSET